MPLAHGTLKRFSESTKILVETGTNRGDAVELALSAGFSEVYTCDISVFNFGWCSHRFEGRRDRVHLFCRDSRDFLDHIFSFLKERSTFWLDAHWCGGNGEMHGEDGGREDDHPLLGELEMFRVLSQCNTHHLLIDDVRMFGTPGWPSLDEVVAAVKRINDDYQLSYEDSLEFEGDVLVARV